MSRRQKDPLRPLTPEERMGLEQLSRAQAEPASLVARAKALLAVANGCSYTSAAECAGRKSNDAVAKLVSRFNVKGLEALVPRHGGGPAVHYGANERARILEEVRRAPERAYEGTASWSLTTLQMALRKQDFPQISTHTIWKVLTEAGYSWQKSRSWCETGTVRRKRKRGVVLVHDPDSEAKKN